MTLESIGAIGVTVRIRPGELLYLALLSSYDRSDTGFGVSECEHLSTPVSHAEHRGTVRVDGRYSRRHAVECVTLQVPIDEGELERAPRDVGVEGPEPRHAEDRIVPDEWHNGEGERVRVCSDVHRCRLHRVRRYLGGAISHRDGTLSRGGGDDEPMRGDEATADEVAGCTAVEKIHCGVMVE